MATFFLVTRIKNCLLYYAFTRMRLTFSSITPFPFIIWARKDLIASNSSTFKAYRSTTIFILCKPNKNYWSFETNATNLVSNIFFITLHVILCKRDGMCDHKKTWKCHCMNKKNHKLCMPPPQWRMGFLRAHY